MSNIQQIIDRQLRRWEMEKKLRTASPEPEEAPFWPVITVSRQHGSLGTVLAGRIAQRFGYTLLHRDIIDRICASTGAVRRIVETLDEHVKSELTVWFESMMGSRYLDTSDYLKHLVEAIRSMAELGGVVAVGRGANFIVGLERGFHVRVVAPREVRIRRVMERNHRSEHDAAREVDDRDRERTEFVRRLHGREINDPSGYDLTINTAFVPLEVAVSLVVTAASEKFAVLRRPAMSGGIAR